jgi:hypothetical protein
MAMGQKPGRTHTCGTHPNLTAATPAGEKSHRTAPAGFQITCGFEQSGGEFNHKSTMY